MGESPKNITIEITSGTIFKGIFIVIAVFVLFAIKDVVLVVLTAIVVASAVEPAAKWFIDRGIPRPFSVVLVYAGLAGAIAGIFYLFLPLLLADTSSFLNQVPQYIDSIKLWGSFGGETLSASKQVATELSEGIVGSQAVVREFGSGFNPSGAITQINQAMSSVSSGFLRTASTVFGGILGFVLITVISFYPSVQEDGVGKFLRIVTPSYREKYVIDLWQRSQNKIALWMQGQIVLALLVGVLVFLGLTVIGVENALLFAFLAAIMEMIPLFGPIIAAIPAVASAYADNGTTLALIVVGLYLIIQQFENHLIYPLVVKKIVGVPPILVILALIVGIKLAGLLGLLISIPVAATLVELLDDIQKRKAAK